MPPKTDNPKRAVTITIDPHVWQIFQSLVKAKVAGASASSHVETLVNQENARLAGEDVPNVVDVALLQKQHLHFTRKAQEIEKVLERREGSEERFSRLAEAYDLDCENYSNAAEVIGKVLQDRKKEDSPVQDFLDEGSECELHFFINLLEIGAEKGKVNKQLLEAYEAHYVTAPAYPQGSSEKEEEQEPTRVETKLPSLASTKEPPVKETEQEEQDETAEEGDKEDEEEEDPDWYEEETEWKIPNEEE
jgi:hypothetical protein